MEKIVVRRPAEQPLEYTLYRDKTRIGSDPWNEISLPGDEGVSGSHAELLKASSGCFIIDLDSEGGTFVNGERVQQKALHDGDKVRIGGCTLICLAAGSPFEAAALAPEAAPEALPEIIPEVAAEPAAQPGAPALPDSPAEELPAAAAEPQAETALAPAPEPEPESAPEAAPEAAPEIIPEPAAEPAPQIEEPSLPEIPAEEAPAPQPAPEGEPAPVEIIAPAAEPAPEEIPAPVEALSPAEPEQAAAPEIPAEAPVPADYNEATLVLPRRAEELPAEQAAAENTAPREEPAPAGIPAAGQEPGPADTPPAQALPEAPAAPEPEKDAGEATMILQRRPETPAAEAPGAAPEARAENPAPAAAPDSGERFAITSIMKVPKKRACEAVPAAQDLEEGVIEIEVRETPSWSRARLKKAAALAAGACCLLAALYVLREPGALAGLLPATELRFTVEPAGAQVYVNGVAMPAPGPGVLRNLPAGKYSVKVAHSGYPSALLLETKTGLFKRRVDIEAAPAGIKAR